MTHGLLLSDDLIFTSRICGTAGALGLTVKSARTIAALKVLADQERPAGLLIDLQLAGLDISELMHWLGGRARVVAYGSHVDTASLRAARQAGCDVVLPRSQFVDELPRQLASWLAV